MSTIEKYREYQDELQKYSYACFIISFDEETICPKKDKEYSMEVSNYFQRKILEIKTSDAYFDLLEELLEKPEGLTELELMAVKKEHKEIKKTRRIPMDVIVEGMKIQSETSLAWQEGRATKNFDAFEDKLSVFIPYLKKEITYLEDKYHGYDVLLNEMEEDFTEEKYDALFSLLEREILPLVHKILALPKKYNTDLLEEKFDIDTQKKLTQKICDLMGYTNEVGYVGETLHPFTNGINSNDVRTTTKYDESLLFSNLYSVMHEVGHATYELQNNPEFSGTVLMGGASCALHESQSRFYENYLGRSREFIEFLYPILLEMYPKQISKYTVDDIYYYCNDVSNQFTRTEADELTYPFHILIRYKIEKELFHQTLEVKDISSRFNALFKEYFGVEPKDKFEGCYQDVHWSGGFGYFPTYALGSAMSAQFLECMKKDFDPFVDMKTGNFKRINEWLKNHVHQYGASMKNMDVILEACKEEFNPKYYINYLKDKFTKIYEI